MHARGPQISISSTKPHIQINIASCSGYACTSIRCVYGVLLFTIFCSILARFSL